MKNWHEDTLKKWLPKAQYLGNIKNHKQTMRNERQEKNAAKKEYRAENREYKNSIWEMLGSFIGIGADGDYVGNIKDSIANMKDERQDKRDTLKEYRSERGEYFDSIGNYLKSIATAPQRGSELDEAYKSYVNGDDGYLDYIGVANNNKRKNAAVNTQIQAPKTRKNEEKKEMGRYGNSYSGNDLNEWWKVHYGTDYDGKSGVYKTDSMTDEDYAIGQQLYTNYQNANKIQGDFQTSSDRLLENYSSGKATLEANKRQQEQNASIAYDKLMKYLPTQIKAQGLGGLGVSESTMLQAGNTYSNRMAEIGANYSNNMTDLEKNYSNELSDLEQKKNDAIYYADKDENGNLLVNNVLDYYKDMKYNEDIASKDLALTTIQPIIDNMFEDPTNFADGGTESTGGKITEAGKERIAKYLEENKESLGEYEYLAEMSRLNLLPVYTKQEEAEELDSVVKEMQNSSNNSNKLSYLAQAYDKLETMKGSMSKEEYNAKMQQIMGNTRVDFDGYQVSGLGSGRENDDITIKINGVKYYPQTGKEVTDEASKGLLNKLTTGSADKTPSKGILCVVANNMYIYTGDKGWRVVKDDGLIRGKVADVIEAFLNS